MKTPVLPLPDYIKFLKGRVATLKKEIESHATPEQVKQMTAEAVVASKGKRILAFKEVLDTLTEQAYYNGQLEIVSDLLDNAEQLLKQYQEANTNGSV